MSSSGGIGSTLTGGIQDVSAILPLLGTEQCSEQVSSALTRGYLYAAATPMSIFGSLGVVSAGFKTLVACFSFGDIEGARILGNMGFEPQGENLSLIMVETGKGKNTGRYIIETRIKEMIKELNIDKNRITGVSHKCTAWNVKMMVTTALFCVFSIAPYIHLNLGANNLNKSTTWVFPVLRATGGFITATLIQLLIQRQINTLSVQYLVRRDRQPNPDVEAAVGLGDTKKPDHPLDARTWLLLLLLVGLAASVVGYVGCFSVVQDSTSTAGPVSWLCLEAGLSVMRLAIWAWNPTRDDAPPLEIILELDKYEHKPFPTCNKDNSEILKYKVLPLTRAQDFLKIITSFAGLIEPFSNPHLSLYYTLTRKRPSKESDIENDHWDSNEPENAEHKLGERILYITVFDHKERTTRVYTRDNERDTFYSTKLDAPTVDVGHFILEVEIDAEIDPKGDPVSSDSNNLDSLRKHHRSILEHIQYRLGAIDVTEPYTIENSWTMKVEDTFSTLQRLKAENGDVWKTVVEKGKEEERNEESLAICDYFMHSSIERDRQLLDERRLSWITDRMEMITHETKERFQGEMEVEYRVNKQAVEKKPALATEGLIEGLLVREQSFMELLLVYEVKEWERLFWNKFKAFLDHPEIGNDRVDEKERWTREWRANSWKRLNPHMAAAEKRLYDFVKGDWIFSYDQYWVSCIRQFFEGVTPVEGQYSISLSRLRKEIEAEDNQFRFESDEVKLSLSQIRLQSCLQMEKEVEDTEFRLKRGSDLGRFDQFWVDHDLLRCQYSRSKWLSFGAFFTSFGSCDNNPPHEIYLHALKENKNIVHITFSRDHSDYDSFHQLQVAICDSHLPSVTSISFERLPTLPIIHRDLLFIKIKSTKNDLVTFVEKNRLKLDPFSTYMFTDAERSDIKYLGQLTNNARVLISFVAPTSGQNLILKLKHSGSEDGPLEVTLGSTIIQLNPSSKSSLTIDDITLYPIRAPVPPESDHLSFEPEIRNDIVIQFRGTVEEHGHFLHDVELLDEAGSEYMPHSSSLSILSN